MAPVRALTPIQTLRRLVGVAALTLVVGKPIKAQDVDRPGGYAPEFAAGDKVRVWMDPEFGIRLLPIRAGVYPVRVVGITAAKWLPDSIRLHRTAMILYPWEPRHRTLFWGKVRRVDVSDGRAGAAGAAGGALAGLGEAVLIGAMLTFMSHVVCFDSDVGCGPSFWTFTGWAAAVTVPVGAIWGARSTKWRKVY
jgi:hypothetical protein